VALLSVRQTLHLDSGVLDFIFGTYLVGLLQSILWVGCAHVAGERHCLRGYRPDVQVMHVLHAGDCLQVPQNGIIVKLFDSNRKAIDVRKKQVAQI
jgi:hypothetical protein